VSHPRPREDRLTLRLAGPPLAVAVVVLALGYPDLPLFSDNQNTKFLHGAARAGWGWLSDDWTANTVDPLPFFSAVVEAVLRWLPPAAFHPLSTLFVALYVWALAGIAVRSRPGIRAGGGAWIFLALFACLLVSPLHDKVASGVARQYILDHYFQPCVFGALLLLAVRWYLDGRFVVAAACLAIGVLAHPGAYVLPAVLILAAITFEAGRPRWTPWSFAPMAVFAVLVAPQGIVQMLALLPTSEENFQRAVDILANERIPHHTQVALWLGVGNVAKLAMLVWASWATRRDRRLFLVTALPTATILLATATLLVHPDAAVAFATPWRASAVLMPIVVVLVLAHVSERLARRAESRGVPVTTVRSIALLLLAGALLAGGAQRAAWHRTYHESPGMGAIRWAATSAAVGQTYLVPPHDSDFDRFRLETGVPVVANWKTHPYKDAEVLEWYERVQLASAPYEEEEPGVRERRVAELVQRYRVTHVVMPLDRPLAAPAYETVYRDEHFAVYVPAAAHTRDQSRLPRRPTRTT